MSVTAGDKIAERSLVGRCATDRRGSGAFVASPAFRVYDYGWLRDGAFCAHALDCVRARVRVPMLSTTGQPSTIEQPPDAMAEVCAIGASSER